MSRQKRLLWITITVGVAALLIFIPLRAADLRSSDQPTATESISTQKTDTAKTHTVELLELLRIWMLARELELSKEQMIQFTPLFEELQRVKDRFREDRRTIMAQLQKVSNLPTDEEEELAVLKARKDVENKYWQEVQRLTGELNSQLTPRQQIKFALFNDTYRQKMRQLIASLRQVGEANQKPYIDKIIEQNR